MQRTKAYNVFEDYVRRKYITEEVLTQVCKVSSNGRRVWSDETRSVVYDLSDRGIPALMIGRLLGIPETTTARWIWIKGRNGEQEARKGLLKEWYTSQQSRCKPITLDEYMASCNGDKGINSLAEALIILDEAGIKFPYSPRPRDAYLFGANHGKGCLTNELFLQFDVHGQDRKVIDSLVPLNPFSGRKEYLRYSAAIGRLYFEMELPKGQRYSQTLTVPDWINGEIFLSEFLGGLFDTAKYADLGRSRLHIQQATHPDNRKAFTHYIEHVASLFRELGVDLTKKATGIYKVRNNLIGLIRLAWRSRKDTKRRLRTKFKSSERILDAA